MKGYRYYFVLALIVSLTIMASGVKAQTQPLLYRGAIGPEKNSGVTESSLYLVTTDTAEEGHSKSRSQLAARNGSLGYPLPGYRQISSGFGPRRDPFTGALAFHYGIDLPAPEGTPIFAVRSGKVEDSGWMGGSGYAVLLQHDDPRQQTFYAHLSEITVNPGQWIEQGSLIGYVGSTGRSLGPHLHFEIWEQNGEKWVAINPHGHLGLPGTPPQPPTIIVDSRRGARGEPCNQKPWQPCLKSFPEPSNGRGTTNKMGNTLRQFRDRLTP